MFLRGLCDLCGGLGDWLDLFVLLPQHRVKCAAIPDMEMLRSAFAPTALADDGGQSNQ